MKLETAAQLETIRKEKTGYKELLEQREKEKLAGYSITLRSHFAQRLQNPLTV